MGTRLSKNPISAALSVTVRYTTVTSVTPSLALGLWRSSWAPLGPGPVFLFLFSPAPRPLWSARPPTDREFNSARPWLPCIHKCYPYEDLTSVPAEGVLAELASAASGHGCLFATTLNTLLYLAKYNIDAPTWKTPFASLYTQWH